MGGDKGLQTAATLGGTALGAILAPFTGGLSIPVGMALGGAAGGGISSAALGKSPGESLLAAGLGGAGGYAGGSMVAPEIAPTLSELPSSVGSSLPESMQSYLPDTMQAAKTFPDTGQVGRINTLVGNGPIGMSGWKNALQNAGNSMGDYASQAGTGLSNYAKNAAAKTTMGDALQNTMMATSIGGMAGRAMHPLPLYPPTSPPPAPIGGGGSYTPVSNSAQQQLMQLIAQRHGQGVRFTS